MILEQFLFLKDDKTTNQESEKTIRSIVKTISWRIIGTIDTIVITWLITGKFSIAFTVGSIELITKMVLYFFHERIWNVIKWGKK